MKILKLFFVICFGFSASCQEKSSFMSNCECVKLDLSNGIEVVDYYGRYQLTFPNETWEPYVHSDDKLGNGIIGAILEGQSFKSFGVTEMIRAKTWPNKKEQQADIESQFNVIESGLIEINGAESLWNLVDFKNDSIPSLALFVTVEHPTENFFYTLNLSVSEDKYGIKELCELENLLKSFRTK